MNAIAKDALKGMRAETAGEFYCAFGTSDVADVVAKIQEVKPDVVLSTIAGETNLAFYSKLRQARVTPDQIPVISCSIGERELSKMDARRPGRPLLGLGLLPVGRPPGKQGVRPQVQGEVRRGPGDERRDGGVV